MLERFQMHDATLRSMPLVAETKVSGSQVPRWEEKRDHMVSGRHIYVMVCTRPDISHAVKVMSLYMVDPSKAHWKQSSGYFDT